MPIAPFGRVTAQSIVDAAGLAGTPCYLYDEAMIAQRCRDVQAMPSAFGMSARSSLMKGGFHPGCLNPQTGLPLSTAHSRQY